MAIGKMFSVFVSFLFVFISGAHSENLMANGGVVRTSADLELIRERVIEDLLDGPVDEAKIRGLMLSINSNGSWPDIDYKDVSRTGFDHARHLENMFEMSRAYKKPQSPLFQNPEVKSVAMSALDFWLENDFICDNWWWNEMGTPGRMIHTLLVLDTDLTERQIRGGLRIAGRANLEASGARPGGDLIQIAGMLAKQALFRRDETVFERVINVMSEEIRVTTGRGLKPDLSFHHRVDNVISTLSYGLGYAASFSYWAVKISGTRYKFTEPSMRLLTDFFLDGICKSMVHGKFPDVGAKNRDLSRRGVLHAAGPDLAENLLKASSYRSEELRGIIAIRKNEITPDLSWNRFFWHSEYFTHQRPHYFASVRMHSSRNHTTEHPHNEESLKMHHLGDGSSFVSVRGDEYYNIFPVWDWQRIPGTTTLQKPEHPHWKNLARKGLTDFVGAVSDGRYGAVAFDFKSAHDPVSARKAWFFFDDEYVCLGAGISSDGGLPVVTTVNQCLLKGNVQVGSRKGGQTVGLGRHKARAAWVYHDKVAYVFPEGEKVSIDNAVATGSWRDINHQTSSLIERVENEVFTLSIDHGVNPGDARYAYIVVPGSEPGSVSRYEKSSPLEILSNTPALQAVAHHALERSEVVFYEPGKIRIHGGITIAADSPCVVMVSGEGGSVSQVAVADPSRRLKSLNLTLSAPVSGSGEAWSATWDRKSKESVVTVSLPQNGEAGKSVIIAISATP